MKGARRETSGSTLVAVTLCVGLAATWAWIPPAAIRKAWVAERVAVYALAGSGEGAVFGRTLDDLQSSWAADFQRVVGDAQSIGQGPWDPAGLRRWAGERIVATWLWVGLVSYRLQVLMGWLLPGMPLAMAAYMDGHLVREIRKYSFVAQSPIRHSLGVRALWIVLVGLAVWMIVPVPLPALLPPLLIVAIAYALWLWVSNLQKRL